jgi:N-acetylmuramoyl-L-alanine amidase
MVVVLDPGHNVHNRDHRAEINRKVDAGTFRKECDTTGTATNSGYTEAEFTLDVSRRVGKLLKARGATVKFTQNGDRPWGPCVDERARIGNKAHADAAVSIHADGSLGTGNRGFHVIVPRSVRTSSADTTAIVGPSRRLGRQLKKHYAEATSFPLANYLGGGSGLTVREDLGGLNLSKVPKVFIECGNMRNATDARGLTSASWRQLAAKGIAEGISAFLVNNS